MGPGSSPQLFGDEMGFLNRKRGKSIGAVARKRTPDPDRNIMWQRGLIDVIEIVNQVLHMCNPHEFACVWTSMSPASVVMMLILIMSLHLWQYFSASGSLAVETRSNHTIPVT